MIGWAIPTIPGVFPGLSELRSAPGPSVHRAAHWVGRWPGSDRGDCLRPRRYREVAVPRTRATRTVPETAVPRGQLRVLYSAHTRAPPAEDGCVQGRQVRGQSTALRLALSRSDN